MSVENSLEGCFGVHISLSGEMEQVGVENVAAAASRKGIERITYVSGTNAFEENAWFAPTNQKLMAEKAIRDSGIPYTFFCPTWAIESLSKFVQGNRAVVIGAHPHPYHWVAANDLARMVSASYGLEEAVNKKFFIHGPEGIRIHDAVSRYCSVFHPEIKKISTMPYWLVNVIATLSRNNEMKLGSEILAFFDKVGEGGDPTEANRILGAPGITLDEWLIQRKTQLDASRTG